MQIYTLDGSRWTNVLDFYAALLEALQPLCVHGTSVDAFIDSMIYGGMLAAEPPYEVIVQGVQASEVRQAVEELSLALVDARQWRQRHYGDDVEISLRLT